MTNGQKRVLREYQAADGRVPFLEWMHSLRDRRSRAIIRNRVDRLEEGNAGHWASVGSGIYELKIYFGPGYRVYFAPRGPVHIILLTGGDKQSQWRDIEKARAYWADYRRRSHAGEPQLP